MNHCPCVVSIAAWNAYIGDIGSQRRRITSSTFILIVNSNIIVFRIYDLNSTYIIIMLNIIR